MLTLGLSGKQKTELLKETISEGLQDSDNGSWRLKERDLSIVHELYVEQTHPQHSAETVTCSKAGNRKGT